MSKRGINLVDVDTSKKAVLGENTTGRDFFNNSSEKPVVKKKNDNISFIVRLPEDQILLIKYLSRKRKVSQSQVVSKILEKEYIGLSQEEKDFMTNNKDLFV